MKPVAILKKELLEAFKTCQEKINAAKPGDLVPLTKEEWVKLFKKTFRFTGGEIVNEFLMSTGYLPGAHTADCPVYKKVAKQKPMWLSNKKK